MKQLIEERLRDIQALRLSRGNHSSWGEGACVMEAAAYVAGEKHGAHSGCVDLVIGAYLRQWNDDLDDDTRQQLKPYIPRIVGTKSTRAVQSRRAWLVTDWLVRVYTPAWLDLGGMPAQAAALRALPELVSSDGARAAQPVIDEARKSAEAAGVAARTAARTAAWDAARTAAGAAAWDAARAAAGVAAGVAARTAARDAARTAAWDAAGVAARTAARTAARDAARDAARTAAGARLKPTTAALQVSAFDLLDRLIQTCQPRQGHPYRKAAP